MQCKFRKGSPEHHNLHLKKVHSEVGCPRCPGSIFRDKAELQVHAQVHSSDFKCNRKWCLKNFSKSVNRDKHYASCQESDDAVICSICRKSFEHVSSYVRHLESFHSKTRKEAKGIKNTKKYVYFEF